MFLKKIYPKSKWLRIYLKLVFLFLEIPENLLHLIYHKIIDKRNVLNIDV